jgi:hypothetical protein
MPLSDTAKRLDTPTQDTLSQRSVWSGPTQWTAVPDKIGQYRTVPYRTEQHRTRDRIYAPAGGAGMSSNFQPPRPATVQPDDDHPLADAFFVVQVNPGVEPAYRYTLVGITHDAATAEALRTAYDADSDDAFNVEVRSRDWVCNQFSDILVCLTAFGLPQR